MSTFLLDSLLSFLVSWKAELTCGGTGEQDYFGSFLLTFGGEVAILDFSEIVSRYGLWLL